MEQLKQELARLLEQSPYRLVVSKPVGSEAVFRKIVLVEKKRFFQAEQYTEKQVFHKNLQQADLLAYLLDLMRGRYLQLTAWTQEHEYSIRVTKKGKVLTHRQKHGQQSDGTQKKPPVQLEHNRQKNYLLREGDLIPPLVDMGVFTKEGAVVRSMYDKYRQINRFVELVDDALRIESPRKLHIIDFGCGKSYLTFILYYFLTQVRSIQVEMVGLDLKEDVICHCNETAAKYGYTGLHFELGNIDGYHTDMPVDMVITLHACDTATDFALYNAVCWDAKMIFSVPCCQHELAGQIKGGDLSLLTRYGVVKDRTAALLTDAIRSNLLTCCGYQTQLLEFVEWEHTPKNLLIRAVKSGVSIEKKRRALEEVRSACQAFSLQPTLYGILREAGKLDGLSLLD